ncbi:glycolate oxidase subunit GlcF [Methylomarinum sp. Ch1-1]|uniref:Glycolate oxidase iron-sulfur subunit n=1 Tax=Methylomarinum roseum TaxID=3067653 RepID=A0AAU7NTZ7_9GAMM|nr:glycolate oxidase subunit GlcF [Methylomarinum sp. Ch1-1]MDP4519487.1 glycolate oxidase subunit GlcF [Methylomarinum sp. Ch1-1]
MQTRLADFVKQRPEHDELAAILRACVHCGFCNATCPTYQLLGDERDGPRGRIYLLKQALEGGPVSKLTQRHLDRCLNCRSCETTCPSGVQYGRLLDLGGKIVEERVARSLFEHWRRHGLRRILPYRQRFRRLLQLVRLLRPILPKSLRGKIPPKAATTPWPTRRHRRQMLVLVGCVQAELAPAIDVAAAKVLDRLGISLLAVENSGCCGALPYHLHDHQQARELARRNIDACWPYIEQGAEAVVMTASGCGVTVKDYDKLLERDPAYRDKARRFAGVVKDIGEVIGDEDLSGFKADGEKIAFHSPCTLQHGQQLNGRVESILTRIGYHLTPVRDSHLCCGSAGVYSLLQPELATQLQRNKLANLQAGQPDLIATANIGCLSHLQAGGAKVVHWIELLTEYE